MKKNTPEKYFLDEKLIQNGIVFDDFLYFNKTNYPYGMVVFNNSIPLCSILWQQLL